MASNLTDKPPAVQDVGTKHYDHYAVLLPSWRFRLRAALLPFLRIETEPLASLQRRVRSPLLDSYFAFVANLGTHTFFMIILPVLFWCGVPSLGRALVNLLAWGVILSGLAKDLLCLPRPMSPPLHRITMSGSVALEYGFPSTHSANAVSVALFAVYSLRDLDPVTYPPWLAPFLRVVSSIYLVSIIFGRLYCGMHGFFDVVAGSAIGALLTFLHVHFSETFHAFIAAGPVTHPLSVILFLLLLVRIHPEPADNCPCFDDSVSFAGVLIGWTLAEWQSALAPVPLLSRPTPPFFSPATALRLPLGVLVIFLFRAATKPLLLRLLPPVFRIIELAHLDLPRRYFLKASEYARVPPLRKDDNVLPSPSEMGRVWGDVRKRRGRAVSVGPQSMSDAWEVLAWREEKRKRDSAASLGRAESMPRPGVTEDDATEVTGPVTSDNSGDLASGEVVQGTIPLADTTRPTQATSSREKREAKQSVVTEEEAASRRKLFATLPRARVRYDVEVVTRLIVYAGIAWLAVVGVLWLFENICIDSVFE